MTTMQTYSHNPLIAAIAFLAAMQAPAPTMPQSGVTVETEGTINVDPAAREPGAPGGDPRALPGEALATIDRSTLVAAIRNALLTWNTPSADSVLDESFYDRDRLLDNLRGGAPLDARIRILGVRSVHILGQRPDIAADGRKVIVSSAVAVVDTQIEFEDPSRGFRQVRGLNEYHLDVTSLAVPAR